MTFFLQQPVFTGDRKEARRQVDGVCSTRLTSEEVDEIARVLLCRVSAVSMFWRQNAIEPRPFGLAIILLCPLCVMMKWSCKSRA